MKTLILASLFVSQAALANLKVMTTTPDLAALATAVGGSHVTASSLAKGTQDPHSLEAKPSYMVKLRDADLVLAQGLELEAAWLVPLVRGARNNKVNPGSKGYLELGQSLHPIEIPAANATRADGDVHPGGNPHFTLDPIRMGEAAELVADRMGELDAGNAAEYRKNAEALKADLEKKTVDWKSRIAKTGIKEIVTYHKGLSYFCDRFAVKCALQLEPKPGVPPTASHLVDVMEQMRKRQIKLVLIENYFDDEAGNRIGREVPGARVSRVPVAVGGEAGVETTSDLVEKLVKTFEAAAK